MSKYDVLINGNDTHQTVDGLGVCGAFHQGHHIETLKTPGLRDELMDFLFSKAHGLGISILRNIVGDSGNWGNELDGPTPSIEPQKGTFDFTTDDQLWFMLEAKKRDCQRFISTVWSPPAWMKTNDSVVGGSLKAASYQDFAEYLAAYVKGYREHHGIEITEISPANEPDLLTAYSSCIWTGDQYADFLKNYLKPEFERQKIKAHVVAPELIEYSKAGIKGHRGLGYTSLFEDDKAMNAVDIIGTHFYEATTYEPLPKEYRRGKPVWMTEYCELVPGIDNVTDFGMRSGLFIAKSIHRFFTAVEGNAYIYFWASISQGKGGNGALLYLDLEEESYRVCKRAYTLGNYSKFIRPGSVRLGITENPAESVFCSAFQNADGKTVIVAINESLAPCELTLKTEQLSLSELMPYRTSEVENLEPLAPVSPNENGIYSLTLAGNSVTTFVG